MDSNNAGNSLVNPLATPSQLRKSKSAIDDVSHDVENAARFVGACLTQTAGVLLRLPQDVTAKAIVIFTRFWVGRSGGSFKEYNAAASNPAITISFVSAMTKRCASLFETHRISTPCSIIQPPPATQASHLTRKTHHRLSSSTDTNQDISAASLYLTAKPSATPVSPRSLLNVYAYLAAYPPTSPASLPSAPSRPDPKSYYLSEGTYMTQRERLHSHETVILRALGFATHVALPHSLCITYLQTLDVLTTTADAAIKALGQAVAARAWAHLNSALLSPQQLYLTKQPHVLATAAIYLAAREVGWKLPEEEWWLLFDTDREDLGFVVVALMSLEGWVRAQFESWGALRSGDDERPVERGIWDMLTVGGVERALQKQREAWDLEDGDGIEER